MLTRQLRRLWNKDSRGVAKVLLAQVGGVGLSFLFSVMLARLIGVSGVGLYFLAVTIVDVGATLSRLGLESASLRFASIAYSQGDLGTLAALYRKSMSLVAAAGILLALPAWLIASHLPLGGDRGLELRAELPLLVLAFVPAALLVIQADFLKGIGASAIGTFAQTVVSPLLLLTGSIVLWFLGAATLHLVVLNYVIVAFLAVIFAIIIWNLRLPGIWRMRGAFDSRRLLATSMPLLLVTSMNLVMGWTDILVLGIWADAKEVGIYGISMRVALLTTFVLVAVNVVVAPQFATLYSEGNTYALKQLARRSAFWSMLAAMPAFLVIMLVPDLILQIFGPQFKEGALTLRILAIGQFVNLATGSVGTLLVMTGHEKILRNNIAVSAALNLLGNLALVPSYGAVGAAASTAVSLAFLNIVLWAMVRKKLQINSLAYLP